MDNLADKIGTAIGAGYSPTEVLDHVATLIDNNKVKAAREAGYTDDEILRHLSQTTTPTSLPQTALMSAEYSLPAMLERGAGGAMNGLGVAPETASSLIDRARSNEKAFSDNYVRDPSVPTSAAEAVSGAGGAVDAAKRLGSWGLRAGAENAGVLAPNLALSVMAPESLLLRGGMLAGDYLMNLGGTLQHKEDMGADGTKATGLDAVNAAAQTALMRSGNPAFGSGVLGRTTGAAVGGFGKAGGQQAMNEIGSAVQGGDIGSPTDAASRVLDASLMGAGVGGAMHAAGSAVGGVMHSAGDAVAGARAGSNVRAYQDETADWSAAVQKATDALQAKTPNASPEQVQDAAFRTAAQTVDPPSFTSLSPKAQNGLAELTALRMYEAQRQAETEGMGRPDDRSPAATFKGLMDTLAGELRGTARQLQAGGFIDKEQATDFLGAVDQAARHNRSLSSSAGDPNYFDSLYDKVQALPIDPAWRNTILMHLRTLDVATANSLEKNAKGFLEQHAGVLAPAMGVLGMHLTGGLSLPNVAGTAYLSRAMGASTLRFLDGITGSRQPDLLRRAGAIRTLTGDNGTDASTGAAPADLMAIRASLKDLRDNPPAPPPAPGQAVPDQGMPVTSSPQGYANGVRDPSAEGTVPAGGPRIVRPAPAEAGAAQTASMPAAPSAPAMSPQVATALASIVRRKGPDHPLGHAAIEQLSALGAGDRAAQAVQDWNQMAPVRAVQERASAKAQNVLQQSRQDTEDAAWLAKVAREVQQSNLEAAFSKKAALRADPAQSLAPRPAPPEPVQAPAAAPAPTPAVTAIGGVQQALAARAARLASAAQGAFPAEGGSWSRAVAQTTGVPHDEVQRVLKEAHARGMVSPELKAILDGQTVPRNVMQAITNHIADLRDRQQLRTTQPDASGSSGSLPLDQAMRLASYNASIGQARDAAAMIRQTNPELAPAVATIESLSRMSDKGAALDQHLATIPDPVERARHEAILRPLTRFGDKTSAPELRAMKGK